MIKPALKSWLVSLSLLIAIHVLWFVVVITDKESQFFMIVLWCAPLLSAGVAAYLCPGHILRYAITIALANVFLVLISSSIFQLLGHLSDFSGYDGSVTLAIITMTYSSVLSLIGSTLGNFIKTQASR